MKHVVNYSGGEASWFTAECVAEESGTANLTLLFADVFTEAPDLYRFLIESAAHVFGLPKPDALCHRALSLPPFKDTDARKAALRQLAADAQKEMPGLVWIAEGRTPWEVFRDERFVGNSRVDPCSKILKRQFLDAWLAANCDPSDTVQYFGLDANEGHRFEPLKARRSGWTLRAPLIERGIFKEYIRAEAEARRLRRSESYELGLAHDNCAGACVKGGQAQWRQLLLKRPDVYAFAEAEEQRCFDVIGRSDIGVLRDRTGGETKRISLKAFREGAEAGTPVDRFDWGGCGCAV